MLGQRVVQRDRRRGGAGARARPAPPGLPGISSACLFAEAGGEGQAEPGLHVAKRSMRYHGTGTFLE